VRELSREAAGQLPRLARLEQIQPGTRISLGLLVEERMQRAPDETLFLFEDRAYSARQVNERIDNVVRGLISIGVRQSARRRPPAWAPSTPSCSAAAAVRGIWACR
jgi:putative long chain acyl-CoA synthase